MCAHAGGCFSKTPVPSNPFILGGDNLHFLFWVKVRWGGENPYLPIPPVAMPLQKVKPGGFNVSSEGDSSVS